MLMECCAAVFVATPDDDATIREKHVRMPRANVMLEFGLVAGRLGRHNIAQSAPGFLIRQLAAKHF
jgi:predicted nucleotide-binding protein